MSHLLSEAHIDALIHQGKMNKLINISYKLRERARQATDSIRQLVLQNLEKAYLAAGLALQHKQMSSFDTSKILLDESQEYLIKARFISRFSAQ